jgi:pimaricinolide synthase PimS1
MATDPELLAGLAAGGVHALSTAQALDALAAMPADAPAQVAVATVDWDRYGATLARTYPYSLIAEMVGDRATDPRGFSAVPVEALVSQVVGDPVAARETILTELLHRLALVLGIVPEDRDRLRPTFRDQRLGDLGLDSMALIRLRNILIVDFATDVAPDLLFGGATGGDVVELICQQLTLRHVMAPATELPDGSEPVELMTI